MDIPRTTARRNRIIKRTIIAGVIVTVIPLVTWGLSRLKPAAPTVERATVWIDAVKRGPMLREVRGLGTLVPEDVLWIPAVTDGRVDRILIRPGTAVRRETILLELSNPDLTLAANDAEWQVKVAEATLTDLKVKLESQRLDQTSTTARVQSELSQAKLQADRDDALLKLGLTADLQYRLSKAKADELAGRYELEKKRLEISAESVEAQLAAQRVNIQKLRAAWDLKKQQVEQLKVRAGAEGILVALGALPTTPLEAGQRVVAGAILAKIAEPRKLKAELKIAETQTKDIALTQVAAIDTRNGIIPGRVMRIDPASVNGTVTVDVKLEGALPQGARPDLSVDGTITLEKLDDVVYVGRPVFGQAHSVVTLFRLEEGGKFASRVQVKLGRTSVNTIEVVEGLRVGDQVVLSDMSAWDAYNRIQLN